MDKVLPLIFSTPFLFSIIRVSTPIIYASLAALISRKSGVTNLAIEGTMLIAALSAVLGSAYSKNVYVGLIVAVLSGIITSLILGFFSLKLKTDMYLASIAVNMFAAGGTVFVLYLATGEKGVSTSLISKVLPNLNIPIIDKIPILGDILSGHHLLTYVSLISVFVIYTLLYKTATGLRIRIVGENEHAAESVGLSVSKVRITALVISGILASLGGVYLSMGYVSWFARDMSAGRGFIGISAMNLGNATPVGAFFASLIFGFAESLSMVLQSLKVPVEFVQMMPYLITIIGLVVFSIIRERNEKKN